MEIWNPVDGSVKTIVAQLPQEINQPLNVATMISVENNTELVILGGYSAGYLSDVWKYKYLDNSWLKLRNLLSPRCEHVAIIMPELKCP